MYRILVAACLAILPTVAGAQTLTCPVRLAWDAVVPTPAAYVIVDGTASGTYTRSTDVVSTSLTAVIPVASGVRHYFAARARDAEGLLSGYSNEVAATCAVQEPTNKRVPLPLPPGATATVVRPGT